jgi:hypothetical protein
MYAQQPSPFGYCITLNLFCQHSRNSVYLYDDKIAIFYNIRGGKQVSFIDVADALNGDGEPDGGAEDVGGVGVRISTPPLRNKVLNPNTPYYVLVGGAFGVVFFRR